MSRAGDATGPRTVQSTPAFAPRLLRSALAAFGSWRRALRARAAPTPGARATPTGPGDALRRILYAVLVVALLVPLWRPALELAPRAAAGRIELTLAPGEERILGRQALAAPAADRDHLRLRRDAAGAWWIANVSAMRALVLRIAGEDVQPRALELAAGQQLLVAGQRWEVLATSPALRLRLPDDRTLDYDGHAWSLGDGQAVPACADAAWPARLKAWWNGIAPAPLARASTLQFGGARDCGAAVALPRLPPGAVSVHREGAAYVLRAQPQTAMQVCALAAGMPPCAAGTRLFEAELPLADATRLIAGRTVFAVALAGERLTLTPLARAGWRGDDADAATPGLVRHWIAEDLWRWPFEVTPWLAAALGALGAALLAAWARQRRRGLSPTSALALGWSVVGAGAAGLAYLAGTRLGVGWSLLLGSAAVLAPAALPDRRTWVWGSFAALGLMAVAGLFNQLALGTQAADAGGWGYLQRTAALAALAGSVWLAIAYVQQAPAAVAGRVRRGPLDPAEGRLLALAATALGGLLLQALLGGEEGVFGVQPLEWAKFALLTLAAHALALRMDWRHRDGLHRLALWWRFALPVLVFAALLAAALWVVRDFSPFVLVGGWAIGICLAWGVAVGSRLAVALALVALLGGVAGVVGLQHIDRDWLRAQNFYGDRFAVWLNPELHPHSGEQALRAREAIGRAGWLGDPQLRAWRIPAVQDDMAPAFLTGRYGVLAAWALLWTQLAYLGCLGMLGWRALQSAGPGDFERRWLLRMQFFVAWGLAALFATHLAVSWGSNFGWLPVMGQPMPLLSAAGSLLVLFLLPAQALLLLDPVPPANTR
jgi:cell division protein FtsW